MQILHICTGFNLDFNGGITNYVRCIAKQQVLDGNNVYILSDDGMSEGYHVVKFRSKVPNWSYYKRKDVKCLESIKELLNEIDFDLIHLHMMLNVDQNLYKLLIGRKYVVSLHDYYFICPRIQMIPPMEDRCEFSNNDKCLKCFSLIEKNWFAFRACRKLFGERIAYKFPIKSKKVFKEWFKKNKILLESACMLIPVSTRVENIYRNSGIINKYRTLHIGNISADDFSNKVSYKNDKIINMVLLSNIGWKKGGPLFFSMLKKVQNANLKIHFYGRCSQEEKAVLDELGIINHGIYKQNELVTILNKMDMGIMTPIWEDNGPQVVMEMINNHLPVFATKMGGITDFVNSSNGYLFNPYNDCEVEAAIEFLNKLNREIVNHLKSQITRTLTPKEHYNELQQLYKEILTTN